MSPTIDTSLAPLVGLLAFVIGVALYIWMSLALAAMFRKMGEESWKGWVPFLNLATVLAWGGFSPLLVLLLLIPVLGQIAVAVLLIVAAHRINPGFGYGGGMTVLAALLLIVWASILGFGPAVWRGSRPSVTAASPTARPDGPPPLPPLPPTTASFAAATAAAGTGFPASPPPLPPRPQPSAFPPATTAFPVAPAPQPPSTGAAPGWAPAPPTPPSEESRPAASDPDVGSWPSEVDEVSAVSPSPFPPSAAPGIRRSANPPVAGTPDSADGTTSRSTGAAGDPDGVISFVPGRPSVPPADTVRPVDFSPEPPREADGRPVTRLPATSPIDTQDRGSERADADVFPELSGEVSAVVGSPAAGAPLAARSSVSAQLRTQQPAGEIPADPAEAADPAEGEEDGEDVDQTVMVRRKKITWQLVPASGDAVPLTADVVVLGRRPVGDPVFPEAQLIAVHDDARTVSKTHARLELRGDRWSITDLGSTNGVLVRTLMGEEIELEPGTELEAGERFFLGDEEFHLQHD